MQPLPLVFLPLQGWQDHECAPSGFRVLSMHVTEASLRVRAVRLHKMSQASATQKCHGWSVVSDASLGVGGDGFQAMWPPRGLGSWGLGYC